MQSSIHSNEMEWVGLRHAGYSQNLTFVPVRPSSLFLCPNRLRSTGTVKGRIFRLLMPLYHNLLNVELEVAGLDVAEIIFICASTEYIDVCWN